MPEITLLEDITEDLADKLVKCFAPGVIEVTENEDGVRTARVANPRNDSTNREVQRHEDLVNKVHLAKKRDHFICK
jgi:DNA-directed RNA polymerase I and III subunit RPAC1